MRLNWRKMTNQRPSRHLRDCDFKISYGPGDDRLHDFYIPALSCSIRYDRSAGFFSSTALAVAAAGIARLIQNGGKMRLLVGAALSEEDIRAIERGHDLSQRVAERLSAALEDPLELLVKQRLEALAWMVAEGTLQVKVVLPLGPDGQPLPSSIAHDYYHPKEGIFIDASGDRIAFSGSINESATGWQQNYEQFAVYRSWDASQPYLAQVAYRFERLWGGQESDWIAMEVPKAVEERLLRFRPHRAPTRDPLEKEEREPKPISAEEQEKRIYFQFLRDVPYMPNADRLGAATATITPWPHQSRVAQQVVDQFPRSFLLCDEVGLGKTIEAGFALRQLVLSGRVKRCLILVPKSILKQWQEELYEKFVLNIPRYEAGKFVDYFGRARTVNAQNPWDVPNLALASSQLVKRKERQPELLTAQPWDLIIVDEAHHARRKDFLTDRYRPNRLLELLTGLKDKTKSLLLLTATPMQIHPLEVWDLLKLLGLGGKWGALDQNFLRFFRELRQPFDTVSWRFVLAMVRDYFEMGGQIDPVLDEQGKKELGIVEWQTIRELPSSQRRELKIRRLTDRGRGLLRIFVQRHTPLRSLLFRSTRSLLKEYEKRGLLHAQVPERDPRLEWIPMKEDECTLYERIEEYITDFYHKYEAERKGLGFVMTVYRRRLTSSFYAMARSLERRLAFLEGRAEEAGLAGLVDDDLEVADLDQDVTEELMDADRPLFMGEIEYVRDFIRELRKLGIDSKVEYLHEQLRSVFRQRETVLIFTQYTDTMDFLREELRQVYGSQVACYSGRGGEYWDGSAWMPTTKEKIKQEFAAGEKIKILIGTAALSEGLNLQTCGVLINYDMPWNPMRVEQRIGRIDRIGQERKVVWIRNYFYKDTIEAKVYQRLEDRIDWFQTVVGELQPILSQVARTIKTLAMTPAAERERLLEQEVDSIRRALETRETELLGIEEYLDTELKRRAERPVPISLQELEELLVGSEIAGLTLEHHPEIQGAHFLTWKGERFGVTFDRELYDAHLNSLRLLSLGDELLESIFNSVPSPELSNENKGILRLESEGPPRRCKYYVSDKGSPCAIETLAELRTHVHSMTHSRWNSDSRAAALKEFEHYLCQVWERDAEIAKARAQAERLALEEQARQLLLHAALVDLVLAQRRLGDEQDLPVDLSDGVILRLRRHGYPFAGLLRIVDTTDLELSASVPFYLKIQDDTPESLKRRFAELRHRTADVLDRLVSLRAEIAAERLLPTGRVHTDFLASPHEQGELVKT